MADKERITRPSSGSNELGTETKESRITGGLSAGTDTQLKKTALGGKKNANQKEESKEASKNVANKKK
ncbi:MAG: hypothetical protein ABI136_06770 [Ginsengibacter sp.]